MKDRHAVTRQMISVPAAAADRLSEIEGDGICLLKVHRHSNKIRPGHLRGNQFRILIRDVNPNSSEVLPLVAERIRNLGLPNYYGPQRFGRNGDTVQLGLALLGGKGNKSSTATPVRRLSPWLRRLALSAAQSALFNYYLGQRMADGLFRRVLDGDVMAKWPFGGIFVAEDIEREQSRLDARETVTTGPMFGRKMFQAKGEAAKRETDLFSTTGLSRDCFFRSGKLMQGTRRKNLIYVEDLCVSQVSEGIRLSFTLPAGSYATVLLREFTKNRNFDGDEQEGTM
jgi:tRNA pseudouridine13 synthase